MLNVSVIADVERQLAAARRGERGEPLQRTSVATHIAWVPEQWVEAAEDVLTGLAERHPSRTVVLFPRPHEPSGIEAEVAVACHPAGGGRQVCTELRERVVHLGEANVRAVPVDGQRAQWRRQERPSRCTRSSALGGPNVPAA